MAAIGAVRKLTDADRRRLIDRGYRPLEVWLPDTTSDEYRTEARRQAASAAAADVEDRVMEWIDAVSENAWDDL